MTSPHSDWLLAELMLGIIAIGSTTLVILVIELHYGKHLWLAYSGPFLAAAASAVCATWFLRRSR